MAETQTGGDASGGESFAELFESSVTLIKQGEVVKGKVLRIDAEFVLIDIGYKSEGLIPTWEFADRDGYVDIKPGTQVEVMIEEAENEDGIVILSKEKADRVRIWDDLSNAHDANEVVEGVITGRVKGGLSVNIAGIKAFLPGSQVDLRPVRNLERMIGENHKFKIIKFNQRRGNIVLSRRALLETEREALREDTLKLLAEGAIVEGVIKNITDYGAFIDLGGVDGLLHITDMSWGRISHPSELFQVGEQVKVQVLKFDAETERVSLGLKQTQPDPWQSVGDRYPIGLRVKGVVRNVTNFGVFVGIEEEDIDGLIHVSDISWTQKIRDPKEHYKKGDELEAVVLKVDKANEKFSLGVKQLDRNPWEEMGHKYPVGTKIQGKVTSLADFGIFVELEPGIEGLVYSSEVGGNHENLRDAFKEGDEVECLVVRVDTSEQKIALSMRAVTDREEREAIERVGRQSRTQTATLGDQLSAELLEKLRGGDSGND